MKEILLLMIVSVLAMMVDARPMPGPGVIDGINDMIENTAKTLSTYCGLQLCPEQSIFHYYECCGGFLDTKCCLRLHGWVIPSAIIVGVFLLGICVVSCFQCR